MHKVEQNLTNSYCTKGMKMNDKMSTSYQPTFKVMVVN